jgi:hypothetical protein
MLEGNRFQRVVDEFILILEEELKKDPRMAGMPAEERTIADDRGLFKPDDLRRMGKR